MPSHDVYRCIAPHDLTEKQQQPNNVDMENMEIDLFSE